MGVDLVATGFELHERGAHRVAGGGAEHHLQESLHTIAKVFNAFPVRLLAVPAIEQLAEPLVQLNQLLAVALDGLVHRVGGAGEQDHLEAAHAESGLLVHDNEGEKRREW